MECYLFTTMFSMLTLIHKQSNCKLYRVFIINSREVENIYNCCCFTYLYLKMPRFVSVSDEEVANIQKNKDTANTKKQTDIMKNVFVAYCDEKKIKLNFETISKTELDDILTKFYVEVRKQNGDFYKKTSFYSLRFSLQRKMKEIRGDRFDIIEDREFSRSNSVFAAQCVVLKKEGLGQIDHYPPISEDDIKLLYQSNVFSSENPVSLQRKVFFDLMLHFCRRGMENLRNLTTRDFVVKTMSNGVECVIKVSDELTKNHRETDENQDEGVMKATGLKNCPVATYKLYLSKLNPKQAVFFQRPKSFKPQSGPWYDNMVLGVKSLERMMKKISAAGNLSRLYTNHSIRSTSITILDQNGVEARHIMSVSGHRSESSLRTYSKTSSAKRREMSTLLSEKTSGATDCGESSTSTSDIQSRGQNYSSFFQDLRRKQQMFREMFNLKSNFIPNFNFNCGFMDDESPRVTELYPKNVYNNCTFVTKKSTEKRKIRVIESDTESSQE